MGRGRREIPLPAWLPPILREHTNRHPKGHNGLIFTNTAGGPVSRHDRIRAALHDDNPDYVEGS
ncbi:MAG: hypothetical protein ACRDRS_23720 [Pseudonocardiaceae bacterium]